MIRKVKGLFILILITVGFPVFSNAKHTSFVTSIEQEEGSEKKLQAIEINGNYISPVDGVDSAEARKLIAGASNDLTGITVVDAPLKLREITTAETWSNMGVQLFKIDELGWQNGIAVIKNKEVLAFLSGMPIQSVFLSDLDNDGTYEIYTNFSLGSGIVSQEISGYNITSNESYHLGMREYQDFYLYIENGTLMTEILPYNARDKSNASKGKVILKGSGNKKELSYE